MSKAPAPAATTGGQEIATVLQDILNLRKTKIEYLYDFGDSWEHALTISAQRAGEVGQSYPCYVAGERNAPRDDCGGIPGFYNALHILANAEHPEFDEIKDWFGDYDPAVIDIKSIEVRLGKIAKRLQKQKSWRVSADVIGTCKD